MNKSYLRLRFSLFVAAVQCCGFAAFLGLRGSARPDFIWNHSFATATVTFCAAILGGIFLWLACGPESRLAGLVNVWDRYRSFPIQKTDSQFWWVAIAGALVIHFVLSLWALQANLVPIDDQADYLRVAQDVSHRLGGPTGLPTALFGGLYTEDNRNPLYVALLAIHPTFEFGKAISIFFGSATVALMALWVGRRWGLRIAAIAVWLLAINRTWIESSSIVACETLLGLLAFSGWMLAASSRPWSFSRAALAGIVFGLAYLAKASAAFPLFILAAMQLKRLPHGAKTFIVLLLGFMVGAGPLLARNVVVFGNPLHSFNNKLLFADSYETGVVDPDLGLTGNLNRFLERHSMKEIFVDRFARGVVWETFVLLRSLGPWPFDSSRVVFGMLLMLLSGLGFLGPKRNELAPVFVIAWLVWFVVFFGWYQPIASGDRFLVPIIPTLFVAAGFGAVSLFDLVRNRQDKSV